MELTWSPHAVKAFLKVLEVSKGLSIEAVLVHLKALKGLKGLKV